MAQEHSIDVPDLAAVTAYLSSQAMPLGVQEPIQPFDLGPPPQGTFPQVRAMSRVSLQAESVDVGQLIDGLVAGYAGLGLATEAAERIELNAPSSSYYGQAFEIDVIYAEFDGNPLTCETYCEVALVEAAPGVVGFAPAADLPTPLEGAFSFASVYFDGQMWRSAFGQAAEDGSRTDFANPLGTVGFPLSDGAFGVVWFTPGPRDVFVMTSGVAGDSIEDAWAIASDVLAVDNERTVFGLADVLALSAEAGSMWSSVMAPAALGSSDVSEPDDGPTPATGDEEVAGESGDSAGSAEGAGDSEETVGGDENTGVQSEDPAIDDSTEPETDDGGMLPLVGIGLGSATLIGLGVWLFGSRGKTKQDSGPVEAEPDEDETETDLSGLLNTPEELAKTERLAQLDAPYEPPEVDFGDGPGLGGDWDESTADGSELTFGPVATADGDFPEWVLNDQLTSALARGFAAFDAATQWGADLIAGAAGEPGQVSAEVAKVLRGGREAVHTAIDEAVTDAVLALDGLFTWAVPELMARLGELYEPPPGGWPMVGPTLDEEVAYLNATRTEYEIATGFFWDRQTLIDARSLSPASGPVFDPWDRTDWRLVVFASSYTYYSLKDLVTFQMHKRMFQFVKAAHDPRVHWEVWSDKAVGAGESIMGAVDGYKSIVNDPGAAFGQLPGGAVMAAEGAQDAVYGYAESARRGDEEFVKSNVKGCISFSIDTIVGHYVDTHVWGKLRPPKTPDVDAPSTSSIDAARGGEYVLDDAGDALIDADGPEIPFHTVDDLADSVGELPPLPPMPRADDLPPLPPTADLGDLLWPVTPDGQPLPTVGLTQAQIDAGDVGHMPLAWFRRQKRFAIPEEFGDIAPGHRKSTVEEWVDEIAQILDRPGGYGIAPGTRVVPPRPGTIPTLLQTHSNSCLIECFRNVLATLRQRVPSSKALQFFSQRLDDWKGTGLGPDSLKNLVEAGKPLGLFDDQLDVLALPIGNAPSPFEAIKRLSKEAFADEEVILRLEWKKPDGSPDGGHAVRIEGFEGDKVYISDPGLPPGVSLEVPKAVIDRLATHIWVIS